MILIKFYFGNPVILPLFSFKNMVVHLKMWLYCIMIKEDREDCPTSRMVYWYGDPIWFLVGNTIILFLPRLKMSSWDMLSYNKVVLSLVGKIIVFVELSCFVALIRFIDLSLLLQITSTLTFTAACASAGITVFISNDINKCAGNHCTSFETATAMAFLCWFAVCPSFLLNFWLLASP